MEILKRSLEVNQFTEFLLGQGEYHRDPPSEFFSTPNFYSYWWRNEILPGLNSNLRDKLIKEFKSSFKNLMHYSPDRNLGIYTIFMHLLEYYYAIKQGRTTDVMNFSDIIDDLKANVFKNKESLIKDKRWEGQESIIENGGLGLWGALVVRSKQIKEWSGIELIIE